MLRLGNTFQFHFSFENSICDGYVTEKFFKILTSDMIPVVLNGANMTEIAPPNSYIDVKDFDSVQGLYISLQKFCDEKEGGKLAHKWPSYTTSYKYLSVSE